MPSTSQTKYSDNNTSKNYNFDENNSNPTRSSNNKNLNKYIQEIESKLWHKRIVAFCVKTIRRLTKREKSYPITTIINELSKDNKLNKLKILAALQLHCNTRKTNISLTETIESLNGTIQLSEENKKKIQETIQKSTIEIGYEYKRRGKKLPSNFLNKLIIPELADRVMSAKKTLESLNEHTTEVQRSITTIKNAIKLVKIQSNKVGLNNDKDFSFEMMLKLKQAIRNNVIKSVEEQTKTNNSNNNHTDESDSRYPKPNLPTPNISNHYIEKEDRNHIKAIVNKHQYFSRLQIKDGFNKIKRQLLRNKRQGVMFILGLVVTAVISAVFPPSAGITIGIAVLIGLGIEMSYITFWEGAGALWSRFRLYIGIKRLKKYSNFNPTDLNPKEDKPRKRLIKELARLCRIKNFTNIYNSYAELEKLANKIDKIKQLPQQEISESIKLEKLKALYKKRHNHLHKHLKLLDHLNENIIISKFAFENRAKKGLEILWNEKFSSKTQEEINSIFHQAIKNNDITINGKKINQSSKNWVNKTIQIWTKNSDNEHNHTYINVLKESKITYLSSIKNYLKSISFASIKRQIRRLIFYNIADTITNTIKSTLRTNFNINHVNPFHSLGSTSGFSAFLIMFVLECISSKANHRINKKKLKEIKSEKEATTFNLFGRRLRTGREEISTLRALSKNDIEPMIQLYLDAMYEAQRINIQLKKTPAQENNLETYDSISEEQAAILILKHSIWNMLIEDENNNTVNMFYNSIIEKSDKLNNIVSKKLMMKKIKTTFMKQ